MEFYFSRIRLDSTIVGIESNRHWSCHLKLRVLMPFQRTFRKSLRRFEERVADPSENLWDDLSKVWRNRFQNTGLIMIWGVCFWVLNVNKLQLIFSRNPTTYFRFLITLTTYLNYLHWIGEYRLRRRPKCWYLLPWRNI